ncbi:ComF family protein [Aurantibacillus circumpalustris]|uniref:ComF family protein n=1 Tax=Aurantibacillus circumpalustris TaxID=3036359 RepID=UPI00295A5739|nr:ComF family protein [Aurantibacillus circumpalustris]
MALINDFLSLIYPRHCEACSNNLFAHEVFLCNYCKLNLSKSNYHKYEDSELARTFSGRVPMHTAASFYLYEKSGKIQKLLHAIKYQEQKELAEYLGELYGKELAKDNSFNTVDSIIPIPLHKNKLKARGFNQSEWFAKGLAKSLNKTLDVNSLVRVVDTATQTKKRKFQRWENVEGIFKLDTEILPANKHVLLVDDVVTTGATIEACWQALKHVPGIKVSLASIAFAPKG